MGAGEEPGVRVPEVLKVQPGGEQVHEWTRAYDELRLALIQSRSRALMHMAAIVLAVASICAVLMAWETGGAKAPFQALLGLLALAGPVQLSRRMAHLPALASTIMLATAALLEVNSQQWKLAWLLMTLVFLAFGMMMAAVWGLGDEGEEASEELPEYARRRDPLSSSDAHLMRRHHASGRELSGLRRDLSVSGGILQFGGVVFLILGVLWMANMSREDAGWSPPVHPVIFFLVGLVFLVFSLVNMYAAYRTLTRSTPRYAYMAFGGLLLTPIPLIWMDLAAWAFMLFAPSAVCYTAAVVLARSGFARMDRFIRAALKDELGVGGLGVGMVGGAAAGGSVEPGDLPDGGGQVGDG